jgi:hypothetical protein
MRIIALSLTLLLSGCPAPADTNEPLPPMQSDCEATHAKVGWSADLVTFQHDVSGRAEIVDDCTIQLQGWTFDGGGVDVRFYVAPSADIQDGQPISEDILGESAEGEELTLPLPEGVTLDDVSWLSLWCVAFGVDFGSGEFQAPALGR